MLKFNYFSSSECPSLAWVWVPLATSCEHHLTDVCDIPCGIIWIFV